jgi:hypothetical protein
MRLLRETREQKPSSVVTKVSEGNAASIFKVTPVTQNVFSRNPNIMT